MEKGFEELKVLFQQKTVSESLYVEVVDKNSKSKLAELKKNHIKTIATFLITAIAIVCIEEINSMHMETSFYGFLTLLGCALYYALSQTYLLYKLNAIKPYGSTLQTIQELQRYKKINIFMSTYCEMLYALVVLAGVYIYLHPVLEKIENSLFYFWWILGACVMWMLFYTLSIKRTRMKKDITIIEKHIQSLTELE